MSYINNILTISTLSFVVPLQITIIKKRWADCFLLFNVLIFSSLHHLVETNEAGHNLEGNPGLFFFNKYSSTLRYLDILFSHSLFGYIIYRDGLLFVISFLINHKIVFILFLINFTCDFIIYNSPLLYFFLHLIWHLGITIILTQYYQTK